MRDIKRIPKIVRNKFYYLFYSPKRIFDEKTREIKFAIQRAIRGFDDHAYWDLDYYIAKIIVPALKHQVKYGCGYPHDLTQKEWDAIRRKVIKGFELHIKMSNLEYNYKSDKVTNKLEKQRQEALQLFVKYFGNFWD